MDRIYSRSTEDIREVYQDILWGLFRKMNVPVEEARDKLARLEEGGMGYLFASMEKMDIQAERRNTQLARQELEEANRRLKESNQRLEESSQRLKESDRRMDTFFSHLISICQGGGMTREKTLVCLQERYGLSEAEAASAVEQHWQHR